MTATQLQDAILSNSRLSQRMEHATQEMVAVILETAESNGSRVSPNAAEEVLAYMFRFYEGARMKRLCDG